MIELPEGYVLAKQINQVLTGKRIAKVTANHSPHAFAMFNGDPAEYQERLNGRSITGANDGSGYTCGGNVEIYADDMLLVITTPIKYHAPGEAHPKKHQLLVEFEDSSAMSCTVQMWGSMFCYPKDSNGIPDGYVINRSPSPLTDGFDREYFDQLLRQCPEKYSLKAFLATEQRIPGLGNGVLHDILFQARLNPKKKLNMLTQEQADQLYRSLKETLLDMAANGGRSTEKDLFGAKGGYDPILCSKTVNSPCPVCGGTLRKEAYLGGSIYYCPTCQPL